MSQHVMHISWHLGYVALWGWEVASGLHDVVVQPPYKLNCWGSLSANKMQGASNLNWWSIVWEGYIGFGGLGGGKQVGCKGGGTRPKSETEPPSLGFGE